MSLYGDAQAYPTGWEGAMEGGRWIGENSVADDLWDGLVDMFGEQQGAIPKGEFNLPDPGLFNQVGENTSLRAYILRVVNFWLAFLGIVAVAFVIYAGFLYVLAGGDDGQHEKAKKIIIYSSIGILVVLVSFALVNTVIKSGGGDGIESPPSEGQEDGDFLNGTQGEVIQGKITVQDSTGVAFDADARGENKYDFDFGQGIVVSLADAQNGIKFISETKVVRNLWLFSDGTQEEQSSEADPPVPYPAETIKKFFEEGAYQVRFLGESEQGQPVISAKNVIVGGIMADFRASNENPVINEVVTLDAGRSAVVIGAIQKYKWSCPVRPSNATCFVDIEEDGFVFGKTVSANFSHSGEYAIVLTVVPALGPETERDPQVFNVLSDAPVAIFEVLPSDNPLYPSKRFFDASGSRNIFGNNTSLSYEWVFKNPDETRIMNAPSSGKLINYEFPEIETYKVSLVVKQSHEGRTLESVADDSNTIDVVIEHTLGADFTIPRHILVSENAVLRAESPGAEQFSWTATFTGYDGHEGGGGVAIFQQNPSPSPDQTVYFTEPGMYDITLTVTKNVGQNNEEVNTIPSKRAYVQVEGQFVAIPIVTVGGIEYSSPQSISITRESEIIFSSETSLPENPGAPMAVNWSVDGNIIGDDAALNNFTFSEVRNYRVILKVSRPGNPGIGNTARFDIVVENVDPVVEGITFYQDSSVPPLPEQGNPAESYLVSVSASDPDTDSDLDHYIFDLLDLNNGGALLDRINSESSSVLFNLTQFPGQRGFGFAVTAYDIDGGEDYHTDGTQRLSVRIESDNEIPVVDNILILSNNGSAEGTVDTNFQFQIQAHDDDRDNLTYNWEIWTNPGGGKDVVAPVLIRPPVLIRQGNTLSFNHQFMGSGSYLVKATVNDGLIDSAEEELAITIIVEPLAVDFNIPQNPIEVNSNYTFVATSPRAETFNWVFPENDSVVSTPTNIPRVIAYFTTPGPHDVTLTVNEGLEDEAEITKTVFVYEIGEVLADIQISIGENIREDRPVILNQLDSQNVVIASISIDEDGDNPQGQGGGDGHYGNTETWFVNNSAVEDISTYDFSAIGSYNVRLDVVSILHPQEANDSDTVLIRVENAIPEINDITVAANPNGDYSNVVVTVDASDADGRIIEYSYQVLIDGETQGASVTSGEDDNSYAFDLLQMLELQGRDPGDYTFTFRVIVKDNDNTVSDPLTSDPYQVPFEGQ